MADYASDRGFRTGAVSGNDGDPTVGSDPVNPGEEAANAVAGGAHPAPELWITLGITGGREICSMHCCKTINLLSMGLEAGLQRRRAPFGAGMAMGETADTDLLGLTDMAETPNPLFAEIRERTAKHATGIVPAQTIRTMIRERAHPGHRRDRRGPDPAGQHGPAPGRQGPPGARELPARRGRQGGGPDRGARHARNRPERGRGAREGLRLHRRAHGELEPRQAGLGDGESQEFGRTPRHLHPPGSPTGPTSSTGCAALTRGPSMRRSRRAPSASWCARAPG